MNGLQWHIGDVSIEAVFEQPLPGLNDVLVGADRDSVRQIDWLVPYFADASGNLLGVVQCFVVKTGDRTLVVDTCVGDQKTFPGLPMWTGLRNGLIDKISACAALDEVDYVICTHLHLDHVGANTTLRDGKWQPTFPNARYLFSDTELARWREIFAAPRMEGDEAEHAGVKMQEAAFQESVWPVIDAGLVDFVSPPCSPLPGITLVPTPGHTAGHYSVLIESGGQSAMIAGDAFHSPCQIARPQWSMVGDDDAALGIETRRTMLRELAGTQRLLIGTHFCEPSAGLVVNDGATYRLAVT